jgi:hypothetical protein
MKNKAGSIFFQTEGSNHNVITTHHYFWMTLLRFTHGIYRYEDGENLLLSWFSNEESYIKEYDENQSKIKRCKTIVHDTTSETIWKILDKQERWCKKSESIHKRSLHEGWKNYRSTSWYLSIILRWYFVFE